MDMKIYQDGSSSIVFTKKEIELHQTMLAYATMKLRNPQALTEIAKFIIELEMAKHCEFQSLTTH